MGQISKKPSKRKECVPEPPPKVTLQIVNSSFLNFCPNILAGVGLRIHQNIYVHLRRNHLAVARRKKKAIFFRGQTSVSMFK